ncbi:flagellar basal body-associated FliL family protein [Candidatus Nanopelagicales bacterium]|jgi:flagellar protein FliL|nr:flagellar basal body-associated FliL family protein [Candidatus Nanopelagicales bacterium]
MAKKKSDSEDGDKGSRLRIVVVVLAVLLIGAGVYMYLGNGSSEAPASVQPVAVAAIDKGEVIKLEPIFINLKNDRFLKVGLALQTTLTGDDAELDGSIALDAAIEVFSNKDIDQVVTETGRAQLKEALLTLVTEKYGAQVIDIYFTEFVMQ